MVVNRSKKSVKRRAHTTHGYGSMKKNRGAGNRGGRGNAGSGKRGDSTKPTIWKRKYFGKYGFKKKNTREDINIISIKTLQEKLEQFLNKKLVSKEGDFFIIDLQKIGFNKLLSDGKVLNKLKIKASYASKKAVDKVKAAGGEVTGLVTEINLDKKEIETKE